MPRSPEVQSDLDSPVPPWPPTNEIRAFHQTWPGYGPTPLISLPHLAKRLRLGSVLVKDEGARFGLGSFKILGSSWALHERIKRLLRTRDRKPWSFEILRGALRVNGGRALCTASDGNHGHALAVLADRLGLECLVFSPHGADLERVAQIQRAGATVRVVAGSYTDAVSTARSAAARRGDWYCPDTALPDAGAEEIAFATDILAGYSTIWEELLDASSTAADLVLLQAGVGAFAASAVVSLGRSSPRTRLVVVEPSGSACIEASIRSGKPTSVADVPTVMDGLRCQMVSIAAWPFLKRGLQATVAIDDGAAESAVTVLDDAGIPSRPSGAAGLGGLIQAAGQPRTRAQVGLDSRSRVVVVNTEAPFLASRRDHGKPTGPAWQTASPRS